MCVGSAVQKSSKKRTFCTEHFEDSEFDELT